MTDSFVTCAALQEVTWQDGAACPLTDELAVFRVALPDGAAWMPYLSRLLSPDETERAARYRRPSDQLRFSCCRAVLRLLLGQYTNQLPARLDIVAGTNQKPALNESSGWQFNVSHSGDWMLIAIGRVEVGIDLEQVNADFSFADLLPASFSPAEQHLVATSTGARLCFYELWTRKEALVKATGKGMDDTFAQIPSLLGTHPAEARLIGRAGHWTVSSFTAADGYPAAVAHNGPIPLNPLFYSVTPGLLRRFTLPKS